MAVGGSLSMAAGTSGCSIPFWEQQSVDIRVAKIGERAVRGIRCIVSGDRVPGSQLVPDKQYSWMATGPNDDANANHTGD